MLPDFESRLDRYAELAVKNWLNVQPGQRLVLLAPLETAAVARLVTKHAYQNGSPFVNIIWDDGQAARLRFQYAPRDSYGEYSPGNVASLRVAVERGDAVLSLSAQDPDLLAGLDTDFIALTLQNYARQTQDISEKIQSSQVNWLGLGVAIPAWASRVFPDVQPEERVDKLWEAIFQVTRMNESDPVAAWKTHVANLQARCAYLTAKAYHALHYTGPGTDLHVPMMDGHVWIGAGETSTRGIYFLPNIPTEEIFTAPHRLGTRGIVTMTKPVGLRGVVVEKLVLEFDDGCIVRADAGEHQALIDKLLASDEGAARLGEAALVPHSSPISQLGITFYNTLFDENTASHLALGRAYPTNLRGSANMSPAEMTSHGLNNSLIHFDFMIGSDRMDIDGLRADGTTEPVMRAGEWAFHP